MPLAVLAGLLVVPGAAFGASDDLQSALDGNLTNTVGINSLWVIVAACFVFFMQAGFAFLEIGFSRAKNAGTVIAKILTNFSIAALCWWAVGFAFAFSGPLGGFIGHEGGFFLTDLGPVANDAGFRPDFPVMSLSDATIEAKFFFQFAFCAVSLAIVWGTTLERIKFGAYIIYSIIFASIIYPLGAHWVFGGGFLQTGDLWRVLGVDDWTTWGMQDFAGSTAVHLIGATGALAALLLLGARKGKYGADGKPRAIPGHNMPLFGLGVLILWLGWFGFNPGSTLGALDGRFPEILVITNIAAAAGVLFAVITAKLKTGAIDIGMAGNGAIAGLVAITAPSGYVEVWAAPIIGAVAGVLVVLSAYTRSTSTSTTPSARCPRTAWPVSGGPSRAGCSPPRAWPSTTRSATPTVVSSTPGASSSCSRRRSASLVAFTMVFIVSYATFFLIKKTIGLRVTEAEEDAGLDISEHGMYGYPEQFIPQEEYPVGVSIGTPPAAPPVTGKPSTASAMTAAPPPSDKPRL